MRIGQRHTDLLALLRVKGVNWHFIAREAQRPEGLERLLAGHAAEQSKEARETLVLLRAAAKKNLDERREEVQAIIEDAAREGVALTTVVDEEYPANLRTIFNLPPFLFYCGELREDDARAVAVVGTRKASEQGLKRAQQMARKLSERGVTVLSGLARGIDTAVHQACLEAEGRTIAVIGSGIRRVYPPENRRLADAISSQGAVVSQFWPDAAPARYTFPLRNVVTSGMGQGTVVIEATATSGAKMQARLALEHGKRVWLVRSLVDQPWARRYIDERGAIAVNTVDEIVAMLRSPEDVRERADERKQLALAV